MPVRGATAGRRGARGPESLVGPAISRLLSASAEWRFGPLVLVAPGPAVTARLVFAADRPAAATVFVGTGREVGRAIASATNADRGDRLDGLFANRSLIVIDELDGIGGPERQRIFVQLFDAAVARGCRFCVSLRAHPARLGFEPQLASRLCGGLVLLAAAPAAPQPRGVPDRQEPSLARIVRVVAARREITVRELSGPSRRHSVAAARGLAMHLARSLTSKSLGQIGAAFGGRDHTTVMHALKVVADRLGHDAGLADDVAWCHARLVRSSAMPAGRGRRRVDSMSVRLPRGA